MNPAPTMQTIPDQDLLQSTLLLGAVVEARDPYTGGHLWRVAQMSKLVGRHMGMSRADLFVLTLGGFVHDVGKVGVPDRILTKKGPLNDNEFEIIKRHPVIGGDLMELHPLGSDLVEIVRHHHEQPDGNGYPDGIGGDEISLLTSIVHVVDAFDALTSTRPYRRGMPWPDAISVIQAGAGTQYQIEPVETLNDICLSGGLEHVLGHSSSTRTMLECVHCGPVIVLPQNLTDGQLVDCPSCIGKYRIQTSRDGTACVVPTNERQSAESAPTADPIGLQEISQAIGAI